MSAYSKVNLLELDNSAQAKAAGVEARFARSHIDSEHLGVSHFRYPPNFQPTDGHSHREQEEVYVVLGGSGRVRLNDDVMDVKQWDVVRVAPSTIRGFAIDVYHVWWDPYLAQAIARAGKLNRIFAHHICDWLVPTKDLLLDRGMPGDGVVDLPRIRRWIEAAGYKGDTEIEIFSAKDWWT